MRWDSAVVVYSNQSVLLHLLAGTWKDCRSKSKMTEPPQQLCSIKTHSIKPHHGRKAFVTTAEVDLGVHQGTKHIIFCCRSVAHI